MPKLSSRILLLLVLLRRSSNSSYLRDEDLDRDRIESSSRREDYRGGLDDSNVLFALCLREYDLGRLSSRSLLEECDRLEQLADLDRRCILFSSARASNLFAGTIGVDKSTDGGSYSSSSLSMVGVLSCWRPTECERLRTVDRYFSEPWYVALYGFSVCSGLPSAMTSMRARLGGTRRICDRTRFSGAAVTWGSISSLAEASIAFAAATSAADENAPEDEVADPKLYARCNTKKGGGGDDGVREGIDALKLCARCSVRDSGCRDAKLLLLVADGVRYRWRPSDSASLRPLGDADSDKRDELDDDDCGRRLPLLQSYGRAAPPYTYLLIWCFLL